MSTGLATLLYNLQNNLQTASDLYSNTTEVQCWKKFDTVYFVTCSALFALPLTIALSFLLRREKRYLQCCGGRPGVAYPWDVLAHRQTRSQTVFSMILLCYPAYLIINQNSLIFQYIAPSASWLKTPIKLMAILLTGLSLHPIFLSSSIPCTVTHVVALLGACFHTAVVLLPLFYCIFDDSVDDNFFEILQALPTIVAGLCLVIIIFIRLVRSLCNATYFKPHDNTEVIATFLHRQEVYVRQLFRNTLRNQQEKLTESDSRLSSSEPKKGPNFAKKLVIKVQNAITERTEDAFYYPVSLMCSMAASFILLYYAVLKSVQTLTSMQDIFNRVWFNSLEKSNDTRTIKQVFAAVVVNGSLSFGLLIDDSNFTKILTYVLNCCISIVITSITLTAVNGTVILVLIFVNYRTNVLSAYSGKYLNLIPRANIMPCSAIVGMCRYGGYQIGYVGWAMVLQFAFFTLVMVGVWFIILMPMVFNYDLFFTALILRIWPTLVIAFCVGLIQSHVPRFVFVVDRGRKLAVRRRTIFMIWSYYSFIISTVMGLVSCLLRLVKASVIAFVFLARLDWCSLPPRFRFLDGGHSAYMGQLHSDVSHSHPVMITFIQILKRGAELTREMRSVGPSSVVYDSEKSGSISKLPLDSDENNSCGSSVNRQLAHRSKDARIWKWLVAYTLINNPTLVQDRKILMLKRRYEVTENNTSL